MKVYRLKACVLLFSVILVIGAGCTAEDSVPVNATVIIPPTSSAPMLTPTMTPPPTAAPAPTPTATPDPLADWTLEQKIGQLFIVRPEQLTGQTSAVPETAQEAYNNLPVGGFILFGGNISDPETTKAFAEELRGLNTCAPWIATDLEGGRVNRFHHVDFAGLPSAKRMAATHTPDEVRDIYRDTGETLQAHWGIDVDFAPVADIFSNKRNTVIGDRSFGTTPDTVTPYVEAAVQGLKAAGVLSSLKHFPGHGDTQGDSHTSAVSTLKTLDELTACEFIPFAAGMEAGADAVMVAHVSCPNVTGDDLPATLSYRMVTGVLRDQLGWQGLVITDAMEMKAIADYYPSDQAAVMAIQAGVDVILVPDDLPLAYQGLLDAVQDGTISEARIDASVLRILSAKGF